MKMNKKGFTLIELLAVIVILAVVALVATPIILASVKNAKAQAAMASANNVITAINYNEQMAAFEASDIVGNYSTSIKELYAGVTGANPKAAVNGITKGINDNDGLASSVKFSGDVPTKLFLITDSDGIVTEGCMYISGHDVLIKNGKANNADAKDPSTCAKKDADRTYQVSVSEK